MWYELKAMKNWKAVPEWLAPEEIWEMITKEAAMKVSMWTAGQDTSWILSESHRLQDFPQLLHTAECIALDKGNQKQACKAVRVVAKYCPLGKVD